ncbi:Armadillo-like helical [Penicillium lagena]|uniref:Armadillo-like helical n=1 Tax=Penicillium lagena TaxID=94218 RepID=UPI0025408A69|nr:Armadillo-like helical [Penicillium lagena]KAJ5619523.1 Armadillo-like helical [Penicillium lagena]
MAGLPRPLHQVPPQPEVVRHVSLEIVNSAAQAGLIDLAALAVVRDGLLAYLRQFYGPDGTATPDAPYIQNKLAQTVTFLFPHSMPMAGSPASMICWA